MNKKYCRLGYIIKSSPKLIFYLFSLQYLKNLSFIKENGDADKENGDAVNLPQINGHFKKYTEEYTMKEKGVSNERRKTDI